MTYDFRASGTLLCYILLAIGCNRDVESLENVATIEKLSDGSLCSNAHVSLKNKTELGDSFQKDNLIFSIVSSGKCISDFEKSLFTSSELQQCKIGSNSACIKPIKGGTLSMYRYSNKSIEINIWS